MHVTIENTKQPKVTHTFETTGASSSQGHNKGSGAGSSTQKNSRSRSQSLPPSRNNPPRTGRDNRNTDRTTSQNTQRSAASTTPRSADEARRIAESEGEAYSFWKHPNVFAKLGLYGGPDGAPTSRQVCYTCESPGHLSNQCIVNAILILQDQIIKKIGQGDSSVYILDTRVKVNPDRVADIKAKWSAFLAGRNALGRAFNTIADIDQYLKEQNSPPILERRRLADEYYGERPKKSKARDWSPPSDPTWSSADLQQGLDSAGEE